MKRLLQVLGILVLIIVIAIVGLRLYFNDARLKNTVMPYVDEAVGRPVQVDQMSLTFFKTFPNAGLEIDGLVVPGAAQNDTLASMQQLVVGVELWPLLSSNVQLSELQFIQPRFTYQVNPDGSTNIDFLMEGGEEAPADTQAASTSIDIPRFVVRDGHIRYLDQSTNTNVLLNKLDADIALRYADLIESTVDLNIGGVSAEVDGTSYLSGLPLSLQQSSTIDMNNEKVTLKEGTFSIRGLRLAVNGTLSNWSKTTMADLQFSSQSDDFSELLRLAPASYQKQLEGVETKGALSLNGSVKGPLGGEELPAFQANIQVDNGYLKYPDLPEPVQQIQIKANASNSELVVEAFKAQAGPNNVNMTGRLNKPLEDNGSFNLQADANIDLSTIGNFYPLDSLGVQSLKGKMAVNAKANGRRDQLDKVTFDASTQLSGGSLQYQGVPKPIEDISIDANATQDQVDIRSMSLKAAGNTFSMNGTISEPLDSLRRRFNLSTQLNADLASIKEFYPIDEDTLKIRGQLTADLQLEGTAENAAQAIQSGTIELKNGFIGYHKLPRPIDQLTMRATLKGERLTLNNARVATGSNSLQLSGTVDRYWTDAPTLNLKSNGKVALNEFTDYISMKPFINTISGSAEMNLAVRGPANKVEDLKFDGDLTMSNVNMEGDSLAHPVKNLNAKMELSPQAMTLSRFTTDFGSSDADITGKLERYMAFLDENPNPNRLPNLTGSFKSHMLNFDEWIDWSDTTTSKYPIDLPDLTSNVSVQVDTLVMTGVEITDIKGKAGTTPDQITVDNASARMLDGTMNGSMVWKVPQPDRTQISFKGRVDTVEAGAFFREFAILGKKSQFHEHITGSFSAQTDYNTALDVYLTPIIATTDSEGSFGMTKMRLKNHPAQVKLADLLKAPELKNAALDQWKANYTIKNSVLTLKNLKLTSGNIGGEMDGTQNLVSGEMDYKMKLYLPGSFAGRIDNVVPKEAVEALKQENGTFLLPLKLEGTSESPKVRPDMDTIQPIVKEYLKNKAGKALKGLLDKFN